MSTFTLRLPRLGETMEEGKLVAWLKQPGDAFRRGEILLEVESDKTVVEVPALDDGRIITHLAEAGSVVAIDAPIAEIEVAGRMPAATEAEERKPVPAAELPTVAPANVLRQRIGINGRVAASPKARVLARRRGVDLKSLTGTGRRGRVQSQDVEEAVEQSLPGNIAGFAIEQIGLGRPAALFLHGFAGERGIWLPVARALARQGVASVLADLPGHGASPPGPSNPAEITRNLSSLLAGIGGRLHLVGHSFGAAIATMVAAELGPEIAGLALIAPFGLGNQVDQAFIDGMQQVRTVQDLQALLNRTTARPLNYAAHVLDDMLRSLTNPERCNYRTTLAAKIAQASKQKIGLLPLLQKIAIPVIIIAGRHDRITPLEHMSQVPHRVALHLFNAGHMPMLEFPDDVVAILKERLLPRS